MPDFAFFIRLINSLLMILLPVLLGLFLTRRFRLSWRLWWIGAVTFTLSQVGHIPFNLALTAIFKAGWLPTPPPEWQLAFNAVVLGLSAGLWEETFRYGAYRWWAKDARTWRQGLLMGAGHGGLEAIVLGVLALVTFFNLVAVRNADLAQFFPPETLAAAQKQVSEFWSASWYMSLLGAVERLMAMIFHLAASLLVLQVFLRGQIRWLWLAIAWHAVLNASVLLALSRSPLAAEGVLALLSLVNLWLIYSLRRPDLEPKPPETPEAPLPPPAEPAPVELPETDETLESTRYGTP